MVEKAVKVNDLDMEKITTLKPVRKLVIKRNIDVEKQIETNKNEEEEKEKVNKVDLTKEVIRTQKVSDRLPGEREKC